MLVLRRVAGKFWRPVLAGVRRPEHRHGHHHRCRRDRGRARALPQGLAARTGAGPVAAVLCHLRPLLRGARLGASQGRRDGSRPGNLALRRELLRVPAEGGEGRVRERVPHRGCTAAEERPPVVAQRDPGLLPGVCGHRSGSRELDRPAGRALVCGAERGGRALVRECELPGALRLGAPRAEAGAVRAGAAAALLGHGVPRDEPRHVQARAARGPPCSCRQALSDLAGVRLLASAAHRLRHDDSAGLLPAAVAHGHAPQASCSSTPAGGAGLQARADARPRASQGEKHILLQVGAFGADGGEVVPCNATQGCAAKVSGAAHTIIFSAPRSKSTPAGHFGKDCSCCFCDGAQSKYACSPCLQVGAFCTARFL
mmetsp:Transcript_46846/g.118685  ORF Transcript_46846/g.118685 Transcript_46846/m.118685 type:complete len:371 (+) Transcript_46846:610-1722(+)